jgi:hypothetical protein
MALRVIRYGTEIVAEAVDRDFPLVGDAEDDGSAFGVGECADELRDGRGRRQHGLVFEKL